MDVQSSAVRLLAAAVVALAAGCGGEQAAVVGPPVADDIGEVTVVSDDSRATVGAACMGDLPDDLTDCHGSREALGELELDATRKAAVEIPAGVASGGYRLRVNGEPLPGLDRVLGDQYQPFRVPVEVVEQPGETVLTVQALRTASHPQVVWQFLLSDPSDPPS